MVPGMARAVLHLGKCSSAGTDTSTGLRDDLVPRQINPVGAARCLSPQCPDISAKACRAAPILQVRAFRVLFLIWKCQREKLGSVCSSLPRPLCDAQRGSVGAWGAPALAIDSPSHRTRGISKILWGNNLSCSLLCLFVL